ncbi:MAG: transcriptional regulator MntR [Lawsonibacter sp.]|nr:transcriptional regulator MntR [Lawsonibacter sp.]
MKSNDFYTFGEYMKKDEHFLTASMQDYVEMIYRLSSENGFTRIHDLAQALNIQPPSATKMVQRLSELGYLKYEKYGYLMLGEKGIEIGSWLIKRHLIVEHLMRILGVDDAIVLQETEKIEHTLSNETTLCIERFVEFCRNNPDIKNRYDAYRNQTNE